MTSELYAICFRTAEPSRPAGFWSALFDRAAVPGSDGDITVGPPDGAGFRLRFVPGHEPRTGPNRGHFDLTSASPEHQRQTVARALALGARHIDVGQLPEEGHIVLADPDGNEFCVIEAGNRFLAGTGSVGALACDGTREVGCFWSGALGWPLVWDQDQETAIQSPHGGTKITWGGPPVAPQTGPNRLYFELALPAGADEAAWDREIGRLVSLGARRAGGGEGVGGGERAGAAGSEGGRALLLDPDGSEFSVRRPR
ncbi:VOC family protein [Streptomyces sp. NBC_00083]|uniref:VOC family protein n=1 Tax=Streptomyces sp. NBC_00083 TaxID=2975647 RepID=UPI002255BA64|nr:VOC family protein [Streptomyces sp. NBC_00083]MCX5387692.1 VOC family protein [Streptomyces sp. NBC_00083]